MPVQKWIRMKLRWLAPIVTSLSLTVGGVAAINVMTAVPASADVGTNDYPYTNATANPSMQWDWGMTSCAWGCSHPSTFVVNKTTYYDYSPFGFVYRNCTDYAADEINEQMGGSTSNVKFSWSTIQSGGDGNAKSWKQGATNNFGADSVNNTPATGSVAWWDAASWNGYAGHVAIVQTVNYGASGSVNSIVVADYNSKSDGNWGDYGTHTVLPSGGVGSYYAWPGAFLHLADTSGNSRSVSTATIVPGDWIGNGKTAYSVFRPSDGTWHYYWGSNDVAQQFGASGDIPVPGYYTGAKQLDWAVYRPSNQSWHIMNQATHGTLDYGFGLPGDIPVPGDYDGDGKTNVAVFRPSDGTWHYWSGTADVPVSFGWPGDIPVPAYWDGGTKTLPGVFRPSDRTWHYHTPTGDVDQQFGSTGDIPVPGYYTGSAKPDYAVYRPNNNTWYVMNQTTHAPMMRSFGQSGDIPVPGMYGGSTTQYAIFRPSDDTWHYYNGGDAWFGWGLPGDIPAVSTLPYPLLHQYGLL
jgi:putative transposon-encoded protein